jgi:hypothetical protein
MGEMSEFTEGPETPEGKALFEELLWVHGMVRRDLDTVRRLADECQAGRPAEELADEIRELETNGPLWRLKVNCLRYCRFVHSHHGAEDALLFGGCVRRTRRLGPEPHAGPLGASCPRPPSRRSAGRGP